MKNWDKNKRVAFIILFSIVTVINNFLKVTYPTLIITYPFIVTLCILNLVIIIYEKI